MKRVVFIASTGGHLNELLRLKELFEYYDYQIITEDGPSTAHLTEIYPNRVHYLLFGSKEHLISYSFKFLINCFISLIYVIRFRPQYIVSTGTHTAVPFCYLGKLFRSKIIYIETFANVYHGNLAGKLIYPIVDEYLIQWEELKAIYPKAKYIGKIY
jgi:UDP-N-acetylglucosamine:LPS N-acetylglucosamine transferase